MRKRGQKIKERTNTQEQNLFRPSLEWPSSLTRKEKEGEEKTKRQRWSWRRDKTIESEAMKWKTHKDNYKKQTNYKRTQYPDVEAQTRKFTEKSFSVSTPTCAPSHVQHERCAQLCEHTQGVLKGVPNNNNNNNSNNTCIGVQWKGEAKNGFFTRKQNWEGYQRTMAQTRKIQKKDGCTQDNLLLYKDDTASERCENTIHAIYKQLATLVFTTCSLDPFALYAPSAGNTKDIMFSISIRFCIPSH